MYMKPFIKNQFRSKADHPEAGSVFLFERIKPYAMLNQTTIFTTPGQQKSNQQ